jgi:predicted HicB family RNase H-like nuclease
MSTEAQKRASAAYNKRQDNIMIRPDKDTGAEIRAAAAAAGQSVQAYVIQAVKERMEREK